MRRNHLSRVSLLLSSPLFSYSFLFFSSFFSLFPSSPFFFAMYSGKKSIGICIYYTGCADGGMHPPGFSFWSWGVVGDALGCGYQPSQSTQPIHLSTGDCELCRIVDSLIVAKYLGRNTALDFRGCSRLDWPVCKKMVRGVGETYEGTAR